MCSSDLKSPGLALVQSISQLEGQVIFAPGPRGLLIPKERLEAIYDLHPVLHVNEVEALEFSGCKEIHQAVEGLYQRTGQLVIVTLGEKGAVAYDGHWYEADGFPTEVVDTVGAGDSHVGAFISARLEGTHMAISSAYCIDDFCWKIGRAHV